MAIGESGIQKNRLKATDEIGGEFSLQTPGEVVDSGWLDGLGPYRLTSSGRAAITLLLKQISPNFKTVLLPIYICDSVIQPFLENGYRCFYYEVNKDLSPNLESIASHKNIGVFFHMGYFGFQTNSNLENMFIQFKKQSTVIVEDITHTLFSAIERSECNDYYIGSIRKWLGIPSGGFLASPSRKIIGEFGIAELFTKVRNQAFLHKSAYFRTNRIDLKELALQRFSEAEGILVEDTKPYSIDQFSLNILRTANFKNLISKRQENFRYLAQALTEMNAFEPVFDELPEQICPLFYPIFIKHNRGEIRKKLIEHQIYCPIHWPIPSPIVGDTSSGALEIYDWVLSIPCDQRYGMKEMERIRSVLQTIS